MEQTKPSVKSIESHDVSLALVGGKGLCLAKLATNKFAVPPGYIVTTAAYKIFVEANGIKETIQNLVGQALGTQATEKAAMEIQSLFDSSAMPAQIAEAITRAYVDLGEPAVAVRSSATAEDLPGLSFAGQQDTYLNIRGDVALLQAVRNCWASLWSSRAIAYRLQMEVEQRVVAMGVVIQTMVEAEVSGIAFTANPATGERSEIVINAGYGLGEAIVSGKITPDTYVLDRNSMVVKDTVIGTKAEKVVSDAKQGVRTEPVDDGMARQSSISTAVLNELATLALEVEQVFKGVPQDIEWAQAHGSIFLLQSRPITNLPVAPLDDVRWEPPYKGGRLIRRQVVENMPDPLSPLFSELYLQVGLEHSIDQLMELWEAPFNIADFIKRPVFVTVNGYAYCRADYKIPWRQLPRILFWYFKFLPSIFRDLIPQWQEDGLPSYLATIEKWKTLDPESTSDEQLMSGIRALSIADADYWFSVSMVMGIAKMTDGALHIFLSWCVKDQLISGMFLRGFPSKTLEAQVDLQDIARRIRAVDSLRELTRVSSARDLISALDQHAEGASATADIRAYLEKYGHRIYTMDFAEETQIEDPLPVIFSLKKLVEDAGYDINVISADLIQEREALEQRTLSAIGPVRRWIFRKLLSWAQAYGPHREEALFYMGAAWPTLRRFALELGRRLVEIGTITSAKEVFYLGSNELLSACTATEEGRDIIDLRATVKQRWQLREARRKLHPPPMVPEGRFKFGFIDLSFFETQKRNYDDSKTLKGFAVSPGKVTGMASVIMSPAEFDDMSPDTILVCPATTPAWTPLFSQALALVTDIGGILAHGSIVAREYGIPAVMGTGNITQRIVTGQRIAVDGVAGTVTILD